MTFFVVGRILKKIEGIVTKVKGIDEKIRGFFNDEVVETNGFNAGCGGDGKIKASLGRKVRILHLLGFF